MDIRRSDEGRLAKVGGGKVGIISSVDNPVASGVVLDIAIPSSQETSSFIIQNRNSTTGDLYCLFLDGPTPSTPAIIEPGYSIAVQKAWIENIQLYSDVDTPLWQIVYTI